MPKKKVKKVRIKNTSIKELRDITERANKLCLDDPDEDASRIADYKKHHELSRQMQFQKTSREKFLQELAAAQNKLREDKTVSEDSLTEKEIEDLKSVFEIFDMQSCGKISLMDFRRALRFLNFQLNSESLKEFQRDVKEEFEFNDFTNCVLMLKSTGKKATTEIQEGFKYFDIERKGRITVQNLKHLNQQNSLGLSEEDLQDMLSEADINGDGIITIEEFTNTLAKTSLYR